MIFVVNGNLWQICNVQPQNINLINADGEYTLGVCDNNQKRIFIANNLSDRKYRHVLTHELCHLWCFEFGVVIPVVYEEILANFVADYGADILDTVEIILDRLREVA